MGKILTGFEHVAAKPKGRDPEQEEAPAQEPMRGGRTLLANPSTDEKKIKRKIRRNAAAEPEAVADDPIGADLWSTALLVQTSPAVPVVKTAAVPSPFKVGDTVEFKHDYNDDHTLVPWNKGFRFKVKNVDPDTGHVSGASEPKTEYGRSWEPKRVHPSHLQLASDNKNPSSEPTWQDNRRDYHDFMHWVGAGLNMAAEARLLDEDENPRTVMSSGDDLRHLAWSDVRYLKNFMQTLNGYGVLLNYTTDYGTTSAEGILHYDGETATVTNASGTSISVPYHNVLRCEPSENPNYPAPHSTVGPDADPGGADFNAITPVFHGLIPSGAMGSLHGDIDRNEHRSVRHDAATPGFHEQGTPVGSPEHPIPDEFSALREIMQHRVPGVDTPSLSMQQQSLTPEHQQKLTAAIEDHWPFQPWNPEKGQIEEHWPWTRREDARPWFGDDKDQEDDDGPLHKQEAYDPEKPTTFFNQPSHPPGWWNPLLWPNSTKPYHERMKQMDDEDAARSKHFNDYLDHILEDEKHDFGHGVIDTDPEPARSGDGPDVGHGDPTREEFWHHSNLDSTAAHEAGFGDKVKDFVQNIGVPKEMREELADYKDRLSPEDANEIRRRVHDDFHRKYPESFAHDHGTEASLDNIQAANAATLAALRGMK